jgi:hypothetical protein
LKFSSKGNSDNQYLKIKEEEEEEEEEEEDPKLNEITYMTVNKSIPLKCKNHV